MPGQLQFPGLQVHRQLLEDQVHWQLQVHCQLQVHWQRERESQPGGRRAARPRSACASTWAHAGRSCTLRTVPDAARPACHGHRRHPDTGRLSKRGGARLARRALRSAASRAGDEPRGRVRHVPAHGHMQAVRAHCAPFPTLPGQRIMDTAVILSVRCVRAARSQE